MGCLFLVVTGILFCGKVAYVLATGWTLPITKGALFVSTAPERIEAVLDAVSMEKGELLVDLGCGDGRVLRAATTKYNVNALGIEVNPLAYLLARILSMREKRIRIRWGSFWSRDLRQADVVFCYLFPDVLKRLAVKLENELHIGAVVISCNFGIPGWRPDKVLRPTSYSHGDPIYVYRFPDSHPGR